MITYGEDLIAFGRLPSPFCFVFPKLSFKVELMLGDVTKAATHDAAVAEAVRRWGRLDVYVNNAAIGVGGDVLDAKAFEDGC